MEVEIQRTIVTPTDNGTAVSLYISDRKPDDESASFVLQLTAQLPKSQGATVLEQAQHRAMKVAQDHLSKLMPELARKVQTIG